MRLGFLILIWSITLVSSVAGLSIYAFSPGESFQPQQNIPVDLEFIGTGGPQLLVFAHPRCPCTEATIHELANIADRNQKTFQCVVFFLKPKGVSAEWVHTNLWDQATEIPGVKVVADELGKFSKSVGVKNSGAVVLYDADGNLAFHGGITSSRGHIGQCPSHSAIEAILNGQVPRINGAPVFGCELFNTVSE